jgi:hypothetical protein
MAFASLAAGAPVCGVNNTPPIAQAQVQTYTKDKGCFIGFARASKFNGEDRRLAATVRSSTTPPSPVRPAQRPVLSDAQLAPDRLRNIQTPRRPPSNLDETKPARNFQMRGKLNFQMR